MQFGGPGELEAAWHRGSHESGILAFITGMRPGRLHGFQPVIRFMDKVIIPLKTFITESLWVKY